jgi:hypothetical protein
MHRPRHAADSHPRTQLTVPCMRRCGEAGSMRAISSVVCWVGMGFWRTRACCEPSWVGARPVYTRTAAHATSPSPVPGPILNRKQISVVESAPVGQTEVNSFLSTVGTGGVRDEGGVCPSWTAPSRVGPLCRAGLHRAIPGQGALFYRWWFVVCCVWTRNRHERGVTGVVPGLAGCRRRWRGTRTTGSG